MDNFVYISSSMLSAIVSKTTIAPFERLKILQQSEMFYNYNHYNKSILNSFRFICEKEGFTGLYKGNLINICRVLPAYILKFPLNDIGTKYIKKIKGTDKLKYQEKLGVGILSGATQITITYPFDFLRTRLSLDKKMFKLYNKNVYQYTKYIIQNENLLNLYKGYNSSILLYPVYVGLQFSIFNQCKENDIPIFYSGAIAGLVAQTIAFPGDVIKRHLQLNGINNDKNKYNGIIDCVKKIFKKSGITGFYTGLRINLIKCIPGASIQFTVYEKAKDYLSQS